MMPLLQSWKESLQILRPSNFKLFFLITLKTVLEGAKAWLRCWWWLLLAYEVSTLLFLGGLRNEFLVKVLLHRFDSPQMVGALIAEYGTQLLWFLLILTMTLSVRPSVQKKTYSYYLSYWRHAIIIGVVWCGVYAVTSYFSPLDLSQGVFGREAPLLLKFFKAIFGPALISHLSISFFSVLNVLFLAPVVLLFFFVVLDTRGRLSDVYNALRRTLSMTLYTLPSMYAIFLCWNVSVGIEAVVAFVTIPFGIWSVYPSLLGLWLAFALQVVVFFIHFCVLLLAMAIISNLYTKQVHQHFDRYY